MKAIDRLLHAFKHIGLDNQILAKKSLGQNFLISDHVISKIIDSVKELKKNQLVEVGAGPGALTDLLLEIDPKIKIIELDKKWAQFWRDKNLEVFEVDALKFDWSQLDLQASVLVSNLPYQISSSLVIDRSLDEAPLFAMVLMFQKEVAQRIKAKAKTAEYGLLTVIAQTFWKIDIVVEAGPRDFKPAPRVASRVLSFKIKEVSIFKNSESKRKFLEFIKSAFSQRRKLLKSNLASWLNRNKSNEATLTSWLQNNSFQLTTRAEELTPEQFLELYEYLSNTR